jgi:uncharacterized protein (TIGR00369 family)
MRKISNPFTGLDGYNCFGCSPDNASGLQMTFYEDDEELISEWDPKDHFHGYLNILHGGIQATLMDEISSWVVYVKLKTAGFTSKLNVRYLKPVYVDKGRLTIKARVKEKKRNLAEIEAKLYDNDRILCSEATIIYYTFPREKANNDLYYPNYGNFFEK